MLRPECTWKTLSILYTVAASDPVPCCRQVSSSNGYVGIYRECLSYTRKDSNNRRHVSLSSTSLMASIWSTRHPLDVVRVGAWNSLASCQWHEMMTKYKSSFRFSQNNLTRYRLTNNSGFHLACTGVPFPKFTNSDHRQPDATQVMPRFIRLMLLGVLNEILGK